MLHMFLSELEMINLICSLRGASTTHITPMIHFNDWFTIDNLLDKGCSHPFCINLASLVFAIFFVECKQLSYCIVNMQIV
jgi:hypothetical protein